eukprot:1795337-Rhodomonas_salina.2
MKGNRKPSGSSHRGEHRHQSPQSGRCHGTSESCPRSRLGQAKSLEPRTTGSTSIRSSVYPTTGLENRAIYQRLKSTATAAYWHRVAPASTPVLLSFCVSQAETPVTACATGACWQCHMSGHSPGLVGFNGFRSVNTTWSRSGPGYELRTLRAEQTRKCRGPDISARSGPTPPAPGPAELQVAYSLPIVCNSHALTAHHDHVLCCLVSVVRYAKRSTGRFNILSRRAGDSDSHSDDSGRGTHQPPPSPLPDSLPLAPSTALSRPCYCCLHSRPVVLALPHAPLARFLATRKQLPSISLLTFPSANLLSCALAFLAEEQVYPRAPELCTGKDDDWEGAL